MPLPKGARLVAGVDPKEVIVRRDNELLHVRMP